MTLFMKLLETASIPSVRVITQPILLRMAQSAQVVYDRWQQDQDGMDDEYGGGGICQDIAEAIHDILIHLGVEAVSMDNNGVGEQHVWLMAKFQEGVYEIDIPPSVYETGGGYNWTKNPDVQFQPSDILVSRYSSDPNDFEQFLDQ